MLFSVFTTFIVVVAVPVEDTAIAVAHMVARDWTSMVDIAHHLPDMWAVVLV